MGFCANCGRQRDGESRFCGGCGTEFSDSADDQAPPANATRVDRAADGARATPDSAADAAPGTGPDPFASWYQSQPQAESAGRPGDGAGEQWQPTETVNATPARPSGYPPQAPPVAMPSAPPYPQAPYSQAPYPQAPHAQASYAQAPYPQAPYPQAPSPGRPERRGGRKGLFIAVAVVVVLAAGGGAYALASSLGKHASGQQTAPPTAPPTAPSTGGAATQPGNAQSSATSTASATPSPALSLVSIAPGVPSSAAGVETLLSHYFHGINSRDYDEYASTLSPAELAKQSKSTFDAGYATTTDSGMTLTSLVSGGSGLTATVTFTSHQAAAQSVDGSTCNDWTLNLSLVPAGSGYLIGPAPAGYKPDYSNC